MGMKKTSIRIAGMAFLIAMVSGCGSQDNAVNVSTKVSTEPVTLSLYQEGASLSDEEFQKYFADPVKAKYPNITMTYVKAPKGQTVKDLLASGGDFPDLLYSSNQNVGLFKPLGVVQDLSAMVKQQKMDLNRFNKHDIAAIRTFADKDELYAIPFSENYPVLVYNKDIFNKFGVDYPKAMTFDEAVALGKRLTRNEGGVQYIGFDPANPVNLSYSLALPFADAKTNKALINNDQFAKVFSVLKSLYQTPGFIGPKNKISYGPAGFFKDKILAMHSIWANGIVAQNNAEVNWDLAPIPTFPERPGKGREVDAHLLMVSTLSKHKDAAFQVISLVTSDERQKAINKDGRFAVLADPELRKIYASNLDTFKGKNIAAIFEREPQTPPLPTEYDNEVKALVNKAASELVGKDVNTVLRETQEKADAAIAEQLK
jgi:multiple sugar transport system substrate-binding protein